jgi:HAD superfamily hydrolase (TIGR01484 family)
MDDLEALQPFSKVQLVAFDLDGTLIPAPNAALGERLADLVGTVARQQVVVTLATGRALGGVRRVLGQVAALNRVPLVLYNGSVVLRPDGEALVAMQAIPPSTVDELLRITRAFSGCQSFVYRVTSEASLLGEGVTTEAAFYQGDTLMPAVDFNGITVQRYVSGSTGHDGVVALLVKLPEGTDRRRALSALSAVEGASITVSGVTYLEIRPFGSSKAVGVQRLATQLRIPRECVLAVGDNDNDVELLEWAGISVCVSTSSSAAQRASRYLSAHGAGEAAIDVLETVRRARRLFKERNRDA